MSHTVRSKTRRIRFGEHGFRSDNLHELCLVRAARRAVRQATHGERHRAAPHAPCLLPDAVPIRVHDHGPYVRHPASVADVAAVIRALPPGVADGLAAIELDVAPSHPLGDDDAVSDASEPDPFTGRRGFYDTLAEVYSRSVLGLYDSSRATIRLFGYVYDPARPDRDVVDLVLRLRVLATLAHELAHHDDFARRVARRGWTAHDRDKVEGYAEALAERWVREAVVPYIAQSYPAEVARLEAWTREHGGVAVPLELLASHRPGAALFGAADAFDTLHRDVARGKDRARARERFAFWLHYDYHFDLALAALERLLADDPGDAGGLTTRGHIHVHQGRYDEAITAMRALLARSPDDANAWGVLAWAYELLERPDEMREARERAQALRKARAPGTP